VDSPAPLSSLTRILADRDREPAIERDALGVTDAVGILGLGDLPADVLWPTPPDERFDFQATRSGAEWIDEIAWQARRRRDHAPKGETLVGHLDWRMEHLRFPGTRLAAVSERRTAVAALVYAAAYGARCQHSDRLTGYGRHNPIAAQSEDPAGATSRCLPRTGRALLDG
jgi:hypothetical protein